MGHRLIRKKPHSLLQAPDADMIQRALNTGNVAVMEPTCSSAVRSGMYLGCSLSDAQSVPSSINTMHPHASAGVLLVCIQRRLRGLPALYGHSRLSEISLLADVLSFVISKYHSFFCCEMTGAAGCVHRHYLQGNTAGIRS